MSSLKLTRKEASIFGLALLVVFGGLLIKSYGFGVVASVTVYVVVLGCLALGMLATAVRGAAQ